MIILLDDDSLSLPAENAQYPNKKNRSIALQHHTSLQYSHTQSVLVSCTHEMTGQQQQQQQSESDPERAAPSSLVLVRSNSTGHDDESTARKRKQHHQHARRFSLLEATTEENHRSTECQFLGAYAHIRRKLDYNYHVHYTKSRQWLHDSIVDDYLQCDDNRWGNQSVLPCDPMLILTVGVQGAGKHHTINNLVKAGRLPLLSSVLVDTGELNECSERRSL